MHTHDEGSFALMVAVYSRNPDAFLLVKNLKEKESWWKIIGEGSKRGETWLHVLVRALWEEGGFMIRTVCDEVGNIIELGDPEIAIAQVRPPVTVQAKYPHTQYFCKVRLPYPRLRDLSGKRFPGADTDEFFETKVVSFEELVAMPDFFELHKPLFKEFLGYTA